MAETFRGDTETAGENDPIANGIVGARVVDQLLTAIEWLNYPAEKLDVIIAAEANDEDTRTAITARRKTDHGLDDASRHERTTSSLLELERLVSGLIRRGELAQIQN